MTNPEYVIEADGLTRGYGGPDVVNDLTLRVEAGSVYGLLGKNGSGKTTTIRMLLGLLWPGSGRSRVLGEDSRSLSPRCRQRIGYLSEQPFPYQDLPMPALLRFVATFFPNWDWDYTNALLKRFSVPTDRVLAAMSLGERRTCELMLVLAQKPDLLILDDPMLGLDVTVRRDFLWAALEVARDEGRAVLFTSHILSDVERVVDTVGILDGGRLKVQAPLDELKARTKRLVFPGAEPPPIDGEVTRSRRGRDLLVVTWAFTPEMESRLRATGGLADVEDLNLEDVFVAMVEGKSGGLAEVTA